MKKLLIVLALLSLVACDHFKGEDGLNSLVKMQHLAVDASVCTSESGTLISSGLDANRDNTLQNSEASSAEVVCDGSNGSSGSNGSNGTNGTNGTVISIVQFCSASFVPSYPSTFPEIGLCIDDEMVGVYSANGGFLAPLPPGAYNSNGINSSCTFTIGTHCSVQN